MFYNSFIIIQNQSVLDEHKWLPDPKTLNHCTMKSEWLLIDAFPEMIKVVTVAEPEFFFWGGEELPGGFTMGDGSNAESVYILSLLNCPVGASGSARDLCGVWSPNPSPLASTLDIDFWQQRFYIKGKRRLRLPFLTEISRFHTILKTKENLGNVFPFSSQKKSGKLQKCLKSE